MAESGMVIALVLTGSAADMLVGLTTAAEVFARGVTVAAVSDLEGGVEKGGAAATRAPRARRLMRFKRRAILSSCRYE